MILKGIDSREQMETRPLSEQDVYQVAALYTRVFNEAPWNDGWTITSAQERLARLMANPDSLGILAAENDNVVGFALGTCERWVDSEHFHLKEMCTDPDRQREGVGSAVLTALCVRLHNLNVQAIYLQTAADGAAESFYRKHGFRVIDLQTMLRTGVSV